MRACLLFLLVVAVVVVLLLGCRRARLCSCALRSRGDGVTKADGEGVCNVTPAMDCAGLTDYMLLFFVKQRSTRPSKACLYFWLERSRPVPARCTYTCTHVRACFHSVVWRLVLRVVASPIQSRLEDTYK